jgi:hypothetical protein
MRAGIPKFKTPTAQAGRSEINTYCMILAVVILSLTCGETETCKF